MDSNLFKLRVLLEQVVVRPIADGKLAVAGITLDEIEPGRFRGPGLEVAFVGAGRSRVMQLAAPAALRAFAVVGQQRRHHSDGKRVLAVCGLDHPGVADCIDSAPEGKLGSDRAAFEVGHSSGADCWIVRRSAQPCGW